MERKIGEVFTFKGKQYEVCRSNDTTLTKCNNCDLYNPCYKFDYKTVHGECRGRLRADHRHVVFKELVPNIKTFNDSHGKV